MRVSLFIIIAATLIFPSCNQSKLKAKDEQIKQLEEQLKRVDQMNSSLLDRMEDLSVINRDGAESIKTSLKNISEQQSFIQDLTDKIHDKDSLNLALVMNLKRSLSDINDQDVQIEVRGGRVHVSISDQLLFESGSIRLNHAARGVLAKIATVLNDHDQIEVVVEGHTDNVPMQTNCIKDNWDLSVKRATTVVRTLQRDYFMDPMRLIAAGRSKYAPLEENNSPRSRSKNRRTDIVIQPRMDQFFQLLEMPSLEN